MVVELSVALAVRLSSLDQCCDLRIFLSVLIDKILGMFFYISPHNYGIYTKRKEKASYEFMCSIVFHSSYVLIYI